MLAGKLKFLRQFQQRDRPRISAIEAVVAVSVAGDFPFLAAECARRLVDQVGGQFLEARNPPAVGLQRAGPANACRKRGSHSDRSRAVPSPAPAWASPMAVIPAASAVFIELPPEYELTAESEEGVAGVWSTHATNIARSRFASASDGLRPANA